MRIKRRTHGPQHGATLIEVLVSILILSFGLLALAAMLAFAVQAPKLAAYRATATNLAADLVERMRVNKISFDQYDKQRTFDGSYDRLSIKAKDLCAQQPSAPDCTPKQMATMDVAQMQAYVRAELPAGGFSIEKINDSEGHLWVMWLEPKTFGQLAAPTTSKSTGSAKNASATVFDVCPPSDAVVASKKPRCLYLRFRL